MEVIKILFFSIVVSLVFLFIFLELIRLKESFIRFLDQMKKNNENLTKQRIDLINERTKQEIKSLEKIRDMELDALEHGQPVVYTEAGSVEYYPPGIDNEMELNDYLKQWENENTPPSETKPPLPRKG